MSQLGRNPFQFVTSGIQQTLRTFDEFGGKVDEYADQLMEDYARQVYERSQVLVPVRNPEITPPHDIEGGSLKQSGQVFRSDTPGEWIIGYGGSGHGTPRDPFYAVYVHEMTSYWHEPPTQAKFLERAVHEAWPDLQLEARGRWESIFSGTGRGGEEYVPIRGDIAGSPGNAPEEARLRPTPRTTL